MKKIVVLGIAFSLLALPRAACAWSFGPGGGGMGGGGGGGGGQKPGDQPDTPGGSSTVFTFDDFLTPSTTAGGCVLRDNVLVGYEEGTTGIVVPANVTAIADGALADDADMTSLDLTAAVSLTALPDSFANSCTALETALLPSAVSKIGNCAFFGCTSLKLSDADVANVDVGDSALSGVSLETTNGWVYVSEVRPLVAWLAAGGRGGSSAAPTPSTYDTADLKAWLTNDVANLEAYLYAESRAATNDFHALTVSGTNFCFTAQDLASLSVARAALQISTDLVTWQTVSDDDISDSGVYTPPASTNAFARIRYTLLW